MRKNDRVYYVGIVVEVISMIGLSRHWNEELFLILFAIGLAMVISGYIK